MEKTGGACPKARRYITSAIFDAVGEGALKAGVSGWVGGYTAMRGGSGQKNSSITVQDETFRLGPTDTITFFVLSKGARLRGARGVLAAASAAAFRLRRLRGRLRRLRLRRIRGRLRRLRFRARFRRRLRRASLDRASPGRRVVQIYSGDKLGIRAVFC